MDSSQVTQFRREGFLVVPDAIPPARIERLRMALFAMAKRSVPDAADGHPLGSLVEMIEWRDHALVYRLQKAIATSCSAMEVVTALGLGRLHAQLYGIPEERIHAHLFQTPVQFPHDKRFDFSWHQESGSYVHRAKILTCWFPVLGPVNRERGSVEVIPGSHVRGKREARHHVKASGLNDFVVVPEPDELERSVVVEMEPGDILIFDSDVIHRSVPNRSAAVRITGIARTVDNCGDEDVMVMAEAVNYYSQAYQGGASVQPAGER